MAIQRAHKTPFTKNASKENGEFGTQMLDVRRVARVVAGGRRFRFRVLLITGNKKGLVGIGLAKGPDVAIAMEKATTQAKKHLVAVPLHDGTIPREVRAKYKTVTVLLRPAKKGKGLIAGGAVRAVATLAGIEDLSAKIISHSTNPLNTARATAKALELLGKRIAIRQKKNLHATPQHTSET